MQTNKLFVYGSLMGGIQSPIANYLKSNSTFLGIAYLQGTLFDIGAYPGVIYQANEKSRVEGHLFQLQKPIEMLPKLDYYECVGAGFETPNEYRRETVSVMLNEQSIDCWTYLYNWPTTSLKRIESGNYLDYFQQNETYQRFVDSLNDFSRR